VRITANQVTMARIFLLPVPVYMLIYGESLQWWIAFAIFLVLGMTDFIDGLMARREGPTRLGGLLDPVADKIFIAAIVLSLIASGIFPSWVASVVLSRELLVTALRSSVAARKEHIKTSKLAKLKTIIQMGGLGTIFFTIVLPPDMVSYVCLSLSLIFLFIAIAYFVKSLRPPFWVVPVFAAFVLVGLTSPLISKEEAVFMQMGIIIAITWISAFDYLVGSYKLFRRTGIVVGDLARLFWAIAHGLMVVPLVAYFPITVLPLLVAISLEFGLGGIDNIVVAEKAKFSSWPFFLSGLCGCLYAGAINYIVYMQISGPVFYLSFFLVCASAIICGIVFGKNVELFKKSS
jgi:cardiolipin synthase